MKKLFTILVGLLVTASVYSQTYKVNTFYAELGGYVIQTDAPLPHGVVVAMQNQGAVNWYDAEALVNDASKHDSNGAKFNDWRLPTKDELNLIYKQKESIGGFSTYSYWSSTQYGSASVWDQNFNGGYQNPISQEDKDNVRGVRNF